MGNWDLLPKGGMANVQKKRLFQKITQIIGTYLCEDKSFLGSFAP